MTPVLLLLLWAQQGQAPVTLTQEVCDAWSRPEHEWIYCTKYHTVNRATPDHCTWVKETKEERAATHGNGYRCVLDSDKP